MDSRYICDSNTKFMMNEEFDSKVQRFAVEFRFNFSQTILNWRRSSSNSTTPHFTHRRAGPISHYHAPPLAVTVQESSSWDDVRAAVGTATGEWVLLDGDVDRLTDLAWEKVSKVRETAGGSLPTYGVLVLDCRIFITHHHVYLAASLLDECEVHEKRPCSICLEDMAGSKALLRMPCSHVFHGGCIQEWLRRSHHCPLCRYEMPNEEELR